MILERAGKGPVELDEVQLDAVSGAQPKASEPAPPPPPPPPPSGGAPISGGVLNGKASSLPKPAYPPIA